MQYFVYIIQNRETGICYKGQTNNLKRRLFEHEKDRWKNSKLIFVQICSSRSEAIMLEKLFKTGVGHEIIQEILNGSFV